MLAALSLRVFEVLQPFELRKFVPKRRYPCLELESYRKRKLVQNLMSCFILSHP